MNLDFDFDLLNRELQQRIPIQAILAHLDRILRACPPAEFQVHFVAHICGPVDGQLLAKVAVYLFAKFDQIYVGAKYALNDNFVQFLCAHSHHFNDHQCHRYFPIENSTLLHITSSESLVSDGTTGYSLWEASVALLALLYSEPRIRQWFAGKRVLELGSGTGLGGLAVAALSQPQSVLLTDVSQVHDTFTSPNLNLNLASINTPVASKVIFWDDLCTEPLNFCQNFDVLLGCDLVYDPDVWCMLLSALKALLLATNSSISVVILICTLRNPQTFNDFINELNNEINFRIQVDPLDALPADCPIVLSSIDSFRIVTIYNKCVCVL